MKVYKEVSKREVPAHAKSIVESIRFDEYSPALCGTPVGVIISEYFSVFVLVIEESGLVEYSLSAVEKKLAAKEEPCKRRLRSS